MKLAELLAALLDEARDMGRLGLPDDKTSRAAVRQGRISGPDTLDADAQRLLAGGVSRRTQVAYERLVDSLFDGIDALRTIKGAALADLDATLDRAQAKLLRAVAVVRRRGLTLTDAKRLPSVVSAQYEAINAVLPHMLAGVAASRIGVISTLILVVAQFAPAGVHALIDRLIGGVGARTAEVGRILNVELPQLYAQGTDLPAFQQTRDELLGRAAASAASARQLKDMAESVIQFMKSVYAAMNVSSDSAITFGIAGGVITSVVAALYASTIVEKNAERRRLINVIFDRANALKRQVRLDEKRVSALVNPPARDA